MVRDVIQTLEFRDVPSLSYSTIHFVHGRCAPWCRRMKEGKTGEAKNPVTMLKALDY